MFKNQIMVNEYKPPDFQFNTVVDEFNNEKIFFKANNAKLCFSDGKVHNLSNIKLHILDDIEVDFVLNERIENDYDEFTIEFESTDGWLIIIKRCHFSCFKNMYPVSAKGYIVEIIKGQCYKDAPVRYYKFIENLNLNKHETNEITCTELDNLFLIKHKDNIFKNIDGYFYTKNTYNNIKDVFSNLYFLLKYYSAESASMRISYCLSDEFQKIKIAIPSQYSNFKYISCFHDSYPNTFFTFLNSTYESYVKIKNKGLIDINLLIHYLAFLRREKYMEIELLISSIILEILTKNLKKIKNSNENKFKSDLNKLLKELKLDFEKLNTFFKKHGVVCEKNNFLSEIVKARNDIVHGNAVVSSKLNLLITTFVNILTLRLLNIDCAMYIPLLQKNVFTKEFINQFIVSNKENATKINNINTEDNIVEVMNIDGKLFLPLTIFDDLIKNGDQFRLLEFETKEYKEDCKLNLKMARLVKD